MKRIIFPLLLLFATHTLSAQGSIDPEFRNGYIFPVLVNSGMTTQFNQSPDLFIGGISLHPQWVVVENLIRVGPSVQLSYNNKKVDGLLGVGLAFKVKTLGVLFGSIANLYLEPNVQFGTSKQQITGVIFGVEAAQLIHVQLRADRDFYFNNWQFQTGVGFNIAKTRNRTND